MKVAHDEETTMAAFAPPLWVGALEWRHPGWHGLWYPEDLPQEWRLAYYANEFPALLVMVNAGEEEAPEAWSDELPDRFRLLLAGAGAPALAERAAAALGERFGGVVVEATLWRPGAPPPAPARHGVVPAGPHTPAALRAMLEAFIAQCPPGERHLFVEGSPPSLEVMRNLQLVAQMLGV